MSKILLVEDDEIESRLYVNLFTKSGHEIVAISNGVECRSKTIEYSPHVIILDIMMPLMNGFETLDVLKFDPDTAHIPIVVLTNLSDEKYEKEAHKRGATLFLTKSNIENSLFIEKVETIMSAYAATLS